MSEPGEHEANGGGFGVELRRRRQRALLTQESLAELAGVDARTIREIETGRTRRPRASTQRLLMRALPDDPPEHHRPLAVAPQELPPDTSGFVGRTREVERLNQLVEPKPDTTNATLVVTGTAGVGKTGLAVHWAHRSASAFPDGQLYVNLRGYDPGAPADPAEVLAGFLRSLGVGGADIPESLDERANHYRSMLANRRMLVLLDNARSAEQVHLLLPGAGTSVAIVTSRDSLDGLTVRHGAEQLMLKPMPPADAQELLRTHIGARVTTDLQAADMLAEQCAHLPLALRVAAQLATKRSAVTLADLTTELVNDEDRLDILDTGDAHTSTETVFSWSIRHLDEPTTALFHLLGVIPCRTIDTPGAAALLGTDMRRARKLLATLVQAHLVEEVSAGHFGMHDLLYAYATRLANRDANDTRVAAADRLLDHYTHAAAVAMDIALPGERGRRFPLEPYRRDTPEFPSRDSAEAWLDINCTNMIALARHVADQGRPDPAARLSTILFRHLDNHARYADADALHSAAIKTKNPSLHGRAMVNYGAVLWRSGRYLEAKQHYQNTTSLLQSPEDRPFLAGAIHNIGMTCMRLGQNTEALTHLQHAVAMFRQLDEPAFEASALDHLARTYHRQGLLIEAYHTLHRALRLAIHDGERFNEACILNNLAVTCHDLRRSTEALDHHRRALAVARSTRSRQDEIEVLNDLGAVLCDTGSPDAAISHHDQALQHATEVGDRFEQARAHDGLAQAHHQLENHDLARSHWKIALELHTALHTPQAEEIERNLRGAAATTGTQG